MRVDRQDSVAERSKALASGASPKGRGFKSHRCHSFIFRAFEHVPRFKMIGCIALYVCMYACMHVRTYVYVPLTRCHAIAQVGVAQPSVIVFCAIRS